MAAVPWGAAPESAEPAGYTYAAVLLRTQTGGGLGDGAGAVIEALRGLRFSGWVAHAQDGWLPVIPAGAGSVAAGRRGAIDVSEALAATAPAVLAVRVIADRQLVLVAWQSGREVARYVSDPSQEPGADKDVLPDPVGTADAHAIAATCDRPEAGEELAELLGEPLDPEEDIESERLSRVLHLLGLPSWLVNAWRLPRDVPTGPGRRELLRLGAGRAGLTGRFADRGAGVGRRWRPPPPALLDPPRADGGWDDPARWL